MKLTILFLFCFVSFVFSAVDDDSKDLSTCEKNIKSALKACCDIPADRLRSANSDSRDRTARKVLRYARAAYRKCNGLLSRVRSYKTATKDQPTLYQCVVINERHLNHASKMLDVFANQKTPVLGWKQVCMAECSGQLIIDPVSGQAENVRQMIKDCEVIRTNTEHFKKGQKCQDPSANKTV